MKYKIITLAVFVFILFAAASNDDYKSEVKDQEHYCKMVNDGYWPNYKDIDCG